MKNNEMSEQNVPQNENALESVLSRRDFVRGAGFGVAAGAALGAPMMAQAAPKTPAQPAPKTPPKIEPLSGPFIDVRRFKGANDHARIQAAIAAAQKQGGGTVYLPAGKYFLNAPLRITSNGITLMGAGAPATVIEAPREYSRGDMIVFEGVLRGGVRQLLLNAPPETRKSGAGIRLTNSSSSVVQDVDTMNMHTSCLIEGGVLNYIERCYWQNHAPGDGVGIWIKEPMGNDTYISHVVMANPAEPEKQPLAGIRITNTGAVWLLDSGVIRARHGLLVDPPKDMLVIWCFASGCAFDTCSERATTLQGAGNVRSFHFVNCWFASSTRQEGCFVGNNTDGVQFTACRFFNNHTHGLRVEGTARTVAVDSCVSAGNNIAQNGSHGFSFATNGPFAVRNSHSGEHGQFPAMQENGIHIAPGSNTYIVSGNMLIGNKTAGLRDEGGPKKVVANNLE